MVRIGNKNKKSISPILILGVAILCILSFGVGLNFSILLKSTPPSSSSIKDISSLSSPSNTGGNNNGNSKDYQLASSQSYGFFYDVSSEEWKIRQQIISQYNKHKNPDDPLEYVPGHSTRNLHYFNSPHAFYQNNYEPNFSCSFERRIGGNGNGDGPKWVCDPHRLIRLSEQRKSKVGGGGGGGDAGCLVYSVGSNGDFKFEVGLQTMLGSFDICEIHIFDMGDYEKKMPKGMNMHYHQWGIQSNRGNKKTEDGDEKRYFYSMQETVKMLGHENRPAIDIFKIDCDKCEWRTLNDWFEPSIPMMQQILVETHNAPLQYVLNFFDGIMEKHDYAMFHKEPNIQFSGGDAIEFGFLKLDHKFFEAGLEGDQKPKDLTLKYAV